MAGEIVIADKHHGALYLSLIYLFQKRLGFDLRFPFGLDWLEKGYFDYSNKDFAKGMLTYEPTNKEMDPDRIFGYGAAELGVPINLEEAIQQAGRIRYVISSLHESESTFARFIKDHAPKAVLLRQCGNPNEQVRFTHHALCSDLETYNRIKDTHHAILYHQEFNTNIFRFRPVRLTKGPKIIRTYLNYLADNLTLRPAWEKLAGLFTMDEAQFCMHGLKGSDTSSAGWAGAPENIIAMADLMGDSHGTVSCKHWDGFGHCLHYSCAIGRPIICRFGDYEKKLAGRYMEDMVNCVKLTGHWPIDYDKIKATFLDNDWLANACWDINQRYLRFVNFDVDETRIREWLKEI